MAYVGDTFALYNDTGLTSLFGGTLSVVNKTDLSDNPQDFVLYLGSATSARKLQATSNPGVDNITLTPTSITTGWTVATAYILGQIIRPSTPTGRIYRCTVAGTSHATTEPTWPTSGLGSTVTDGTCTWEYYSNRHATTEVKLALSSGGLAGATAGAALNVATVINSGSANDVAIHIRITNAVTSVSNNSGYPELGLYINACIETGA